MAEEINPIEFFEFLAGYDHYPTNGYELGEEAKKQGFSKELVLFFEGMPGEFRDESEIMPYAEEISKPPTGKRLEEPRDDGDQLTLGDVKQGE